MEMITIFREGAQGRAWEGIDRGKWSLFKTLVVYEAKALRDRR